MDYGFLSDCGIALLCDIVDCLPSMPGDLRQWVNYHITDPYFDMAIFKTNKRRLSKYCTVLAPLQRVDDVTILSDPQAHASNYQGRYSLYRYMIDDLKVSGGFAKFPDAYGWAKDVINSPSSDYESLYQLEEKIDYMLANLDGAKELQHRLAAFFTKDVMPWKARACDIYTSITWRANNGPEACVDSNYMLSDIVYGLSHIPSIKYLSVADVNDIAIQIAAYFHTIHPDKPPKINRFLCALEIPVQTTELVDAVWHCVENKDTIDCLSNLVYPEKYGYSSSDEKLKSTEVNTINGYSIIQNYHRNRVADKESLFNITNDLRFMNNAEIAAYQKDDICGPDIELHLDATDIGTLRDTNLSVFVAVDMNNNMDTRYVALNMDDEAFLLYTFKFEKAHRVYGISLKKYPDNSRKIITVNGRNVDSFLYKSGF